MKKLLLITGLVLFSLIGFSQNKTIDLDKTSSFGVLTADTGDVITLRVDTIKKIRAPLHGF